MPEEPLDPTEALKHIRAFVKVWRVKAYGTPFEAAFREIGNVVDKALPPKRRERQKPEKPEP